MARSRNARSIVFPSLLLVLAAAILGLPSACTAQKTAPAAPQAKAAAPRLVYPEARVVDVADDYHGTRVPDPYRWLEDPDSEETRAWVKAECDLTFPWLHAIPQRKKILARLTELWNYEKFGLPRKEGGRYFFTRNDGLQNQSVLYWTASLEAEPKVLLDPNTLSEDGTVALAGLAVSRDGKYAAYGISRAGSDWTEFFVREVDTGKDLPDHLQWIKFSGASWDAEGKGFYYSRYDAPEEGEGLRQANYFHKLYYHALGTDQARDRRVYERTDHKDWNINGTVTPDGRYLLIVVGKGTDRRNLVFYKALDGTDGKVKPLVPEFEAQYRYIANDGPLFWFYTDLDAPMGKVIALDLEHPEKDALPTVIPEAKEALRDVGMVHDTFIASYLKDACTQVKLFDRKGRFLRELPLPGLGTAGGFTGKRTDTETFFRYTSYTDPGSIYRLDLETGACTLFRRSPLHFDPADYVTERVFYRSKDGTRVPLFLSYKKGLERNGRSPTLLYGYGGFDIAITPHFSVANLVWMEMGGLYAVACIRGGGEYGEAWHEAGMKHKKQNGFDDFIAAAEWLIREQYTSTPRLAIAGGSNGGLLVGACMVQRPDLFGACLPAVGVMDMLRFHKFTIGWAWVSDYGSPDDPEDFKYLYAYSPYHNIEDGVSYPATLILTADHDDRVVPGHSFKFAARLQAAQGGDAPILIRIQRKAGHGGGKPTAMRIEEAADRLAFLVKVLHMEE